MDTKLLILAIIFLLSGVYLLYKAIKSKAGVIAVILGALMVIIGAACFITEYLYGAEVSVRVLFFGFGILMLSLVANSFATFKECSTAVPARYVGCEYNYKNTYAPIFEYEYECVKYRIRVTQAFSKSYITEHYESDPENCEVYINPENPKIAVSKRKVGAAEIFLGVLGVLIIGFVVYTVINPGIFTFD